MVLPFRILGFFDEFWPTNPTRSSISAVFAELGKFLSPVWLWRDSSGGECSHHRSFVSAGDFIRVCQRLKGQSLLLRKLSWSVIISCQCNPGSGHSHNISDSVPLWPLSCQQMVELCSCVFEKWWRAWHGGFLLILWGILSQAHGDFQRGGILLIIPQGSSALSAILQIKHGCAFLVTKATL